MNEFMIDTKKYPKPRSRHHNAANVYFPLDKLEKTPRYYPPLIDNINWSDCFENGLPPNILDIGCGWGSLMLKHAWNNPGKNILGVEIRQLLTEWINQIIAGESFSNAHALWYSLPNGLHFLEDESIEEFYSFFPDPWVKKKHHKRRAFTKELIEECLRIAKPHARFRIMTDVPEVAEYQLALLKEYPQFIQEYAEYCGEHEAIWDDIVKTLHLNEYSSEHWNIPMTDQEVFSRKKHIPYLRISYRIQIK
jgi:tRNA (guanine-N7-)-methyltransferase